MSTRNTNLGLIREKRAKTYMEKCLHWEVQKTTIALDKYHSIDFIATNKNNERMVIQVKGLSHLTKEPHPKAIEYAQNNNCKLYYIYVGCSYNSKIYTKKKYEPKREKEEDNRRLD